MAEERRRLRVSRILILGLVVVIIILGSQHNGAGQCELPGLP